MAEGSSDCLVYAALGPEKLGTSGAHRTRLVLPVLSLSGCFKLGEDFPEEQGDVEVKGGTVGGCGGPGGPRASQAVSLREESQEGPFCKLQGAAFCLAKLASLLLDLSY